MRLKFRILLLKEGKRLKKSDFKELRSPLYTGMRYITEFKYLEATKWLLIAEDCFERNLLLGLVNLALGQEEQAQEFFESARGQRRLTDIDILVDFPDEGERFRISGVEDLGKVELKARAT